MKTYDEKNVPKEYELNKKEQAEYEKFIKSSYMPKNDENRFAKGVTGLTEYDYINLSSNNSIEGHNRKRFALLDCEYFKEYFDVVQNADKQTTYVSYLDEKDINKGIYPHQLSVLVKKVGYEKFAYNEVIASKILNYFGVNCVFNKYLKFDNEIYVLSLDFLKPNEMFFDFSEFSDFYLINSNGDIRDSLDALDFKSDSLKKRLAFELGESVIIDKEKLKEDYVKTYLTRVLLIGDGDFNCRNSGFVYNLEKNEIMCNPNFDFEYAFAMETNEFACYKSNLNYIRNNFTKIYEEFIEKLKNFNSINQKTKRFVYEDIIKSEVFDKTTIKVYSNDIEENIDILMNDYYEYVSKKQKQ